MECKILDSRGAMHRCYKCNAQEACFNAGPLATEVRCTCAQMVCYLAAYTPCAPVVGLLKLLRVPLDCNPSEHYSDWLI